jgi:hypothetical protein
MRKRVVRKTLNVVLLWPLAVVIDILFLFEKHNPFLFSVARFLRNNFYRKERAENQYISLI